MKDSKELQEIAIVGTARTPIGGLLGNLSSLKAPELGAIVVRSALERAGIPADRVGELFMGTVLSAGQGQAPARQVVLGAGLPLSVSATTVNKVCGSGMKAVMLAHDSLRLGNHSCIVAGGMESMSNAPYFLDKARAGYRRGHGTIKDHMFFDGLEDAYDKGKLMGVFAEATAEKYNFTRAMQDKYALSSLAQARDAIRSGAFQEEIVLVKVKGKKDEQNISEDELPRQAEPEKIPQLRPAFKDNGTVTAANSSSIADGAAAHVLMSVAEAEKQAIRPLAIIKAQASHSQEPQWFTTAPVEAIRKVLANAQWTADMVDLFEINEAFAVVTMAAMADLKLPREKVNIYGGACALGHPIGASGARILCTLIHALKRNQLKRGVAALCIGGGEAVAMAIEVFSA